MNEDTAKGIDDVERFYMVLEPETEKQALYRKDLHLDKSQHPTNPLFKGKWE